MAVGFNCFWRSIISLPSWVLERIFLLLCRLLHHHRRFFLSSQPLFQREYMLLSTSELLSLGSVLRFEVIVLLSAISNMASPQLYILFKRGKKRNFNNNLFKYAISFVVRILRGERCSVVVEYSGMCNLRYCVILSGSSSVS